MSAAALLDFRLVARGGAFCQIQHRRQLATFETLAVLQPDGGRLHTSVICRDPDGMIRLRCKGAASAIFPLLAADQQVGLKR